VSVTICAVWGCGCGCGWVGGGGCTQVSAVRYSDCGDFLFSGSYDRSSKVRVYTYSILRRIWDPYSRLGHIWDTYSILGHILFLALNDRSSKVRVEIGV
jgi:hypothetical protein